MFLAWKEIFKEKSRFILIILVIVLVSYLVFFLTGLAYGLASSYTQGIEKWQADGIIIQSDANDTIARSRILESDVEKISANEKATLGLGSAVVLPIADEEDEKVDATIFGISKDEFLMPNVVEGNIFSSKNEVVVDESLKDLGYEVGDELDLSNIATRHKIVGFTDIAKYQTAPIIYMSTDDWRHLLEETMDGRITGPKYVNAVITRNTENYDSNFLDELKLSFMTINDYIFTLPGYNAQVLTFSIMIFFLILIAAFVLGIFIYILTIQKKGIFGVLKAQGISNFMVAGSVMSQTFILAIIGMSLGLALTLITGWALYGIVPFMVNVFFFVGISVIFLLFSLFSAIFSVRSVVKIDPARAIA
ncbi:MAG: hypothetical protein PHC34_07860 [Candidatus Gastranaerophilales bacterium]|nr:hypothetical protein [Candidatus Gastranaerophilales bacterium]